MCRNDQRYSNVCNVKKIIIYQVSEGLPLQSSVESLCLEVTFKTFLTSLCKSTLESGTYLIQTVKINEKFSPAAFLMI